MATLKTDFEWFGAVSARFVPSRLFMLLPQCFAFCLHAILHDVATLSIIGLVAQCVYLFHHSIIRGHPALVATSVGLHSQTSDKALAAFLRYHAFTASGHR